MMTSIGIFRVTVTPTDSHIGLPKVDFDEKRLYEIELNLPESQRVELAGIMASHVMFTKHDGEFPTTREESHHRSASEKIGYDGLVVTDSLTMQAVWSHYTLEEIVPRFQFGLRYPVACGAEMSICKNVSMNWHLIMPEAAKSRWKQSTKPERILRYKALYQIEIIRSFEMVKPKLLVPKAVSFSEKVSLESITLIQDPHGLLPIKPQERTLIVFPKIKVVTLVEDPVNGLLSLHDYMKDCADKFYISLTPTEEETKDLNSMIDRYDKIVYCSYNARLNEGQAEVIRQIDVKKLIVASLVRRTTFRSCTLIQPIYVLTKQRR